MIHLRYVTLSCSGITLSWILDFKCVMFLFFNVYCEIQVWRECQIMYIDCISVQLMICLEFWVYIFRRNNRLDLFLFGILNQFFQQIGLWSFTLLNMKVVAESYEKQQPSPCIWLLLRIIKKKRNPKVRNSPPFSFSFWYHMHLLEFQILNLTWKYVFLQADMDIYC